MEAPDLQQQLFSHIKEMIPPHLSLVDELCEMLDLSPDSVYRRIRGEKPISLQELKRICDHYHLSLDQLLQINSDAVVFSAPNRGKKDVPFIEILKSMLEHLKYFNSFGKKRMLYLCKDLPLWHFFYYPELGAFKSFVWAKTIHNDPAFRDKQFSVDEFKLEEYNALGIQMLQEYNKMDSVELYNEESINSTISQVKFFKDSGGFRTQRDVDQVLNALERTIVHMKAQAEKGEKFIPGGSDLIHRGKLELYVNEIVIGTNTIILELDNLRLLFIIYNVLSFMFTRDVPFSNDVYDGFQNLRSRSMLISATGEKERNRFFNVMLDRINSLRK